MRCNECGAEASIESVFCHKCGARFEVDPVPAGRDDEPASEGSAGDGAAADPQPADAPTRRTPGEKLFTPPGGDNRGGGGDDDEETTLWEGRYCAQAMLGQWVLTALLSVVVIVAKVIFFGDSEVWLYLLIGLALLWCIQYLRYLCRRLSVHYRLTNHRFFHTAGLIRRVADRIEVIDMDDVTCVQGPIERVVGVGTIRVTSSDRTHPVIDLPGIADAQEVTEKIDKARRAERLKRGIHIESI